MPMEFLHLFVKPRVASFAAKFKKYMDDYALYMHNLEEALLAVLMPDDS